MLCQFFRFSCHLSRLQSSFTFAHRFLGELSGAIGSFNFSQKMVIRHGVTCVNSRLWAAIWWFGMRGFRCLFSLCASSIGFWTEPFIRVFSFRVWIGADERVSLMSTHNAGKLQALIVDSVCASLARLYNHGEILRFLLQTHPIKNLSASA